MFTDYELLLLASKSMFWLSIATLCFIVYVGYSDLGD